MPPLLYGVGWNMCSKIVLQISCALHCTTYGLFFPTCHQIPLFLSVFRLINSFLKKSLLMVVLLLSLGFHVSFSSPKVMSPYWLGIPQTQTGQAFRGYIFSYQHLVKSTASSRYSQLYVGAPLGSIFYAAPTRNPLSAGASLSSPFLKNDATF